MSTSATAERLPAKYYPLWGVLPAATDPFTLIEGVQTGDPVFYAPNTHNSGSGTWVFTRFDRIKDLYTRTEQLSVKNQTGIGALLGEEMRMIPTEADAPDHSGYRGVLRPFFSNTPLENLEPSIIALSQDLIARVSADKQCEFMADYAQRFPVGVFLRLMGLPHDDIDMLNELAHRLTYDPDFAEKARALSDIRDYLRDHIRRAEAAPREDILSSIVTARIGDRPINDEEKYSIALNVFIGGMDTVAASLGWHFRHLAIDQALQARLRANRAEIPAAVEEMLRTYSVVSSCRTALVDFEVDGVTIRQGDILTLGTELANRDPGTFAHPETVDIDRSPNRHLAFGYGLHHCLGAPLARRELRIALNSWFDNVPTFRIDGNPDEGLPGWIGNMISLEKLHLAWD